jgi:hypothetical protein
MPTVALSTSAAARAGARLPGARLPGARPAARAPLRIAAFVDGEQKDTPYQSAGLAPAFTRRRERAVSRLAMYVKKNRP